MTKMRAKKKSVWGECTGVDEGGEGGSAVNAINVDI